MKVTLSGTQLGSVFALSAAFLFSTKAIFIKQAYELSSLVDGTVLMALRSGHSRHTGRSWPAERCPSRCHYTGY